MIKYNIIVCRYDKMLVNVAAYVIPDSVCVCVCVWCAGQDYTISVLLTTAISLCQIFLSNSYRLFVAYEKCGKKRGWKGRWLLSSAGLTLTLLKTSSYYATDELFCVN